MANLIWKPLTQSIDPQKPFRFIIELDTQDPFEDDPNGLLFKQWIEAGEPQGNGLVIDEMIYSLGYGHQNWGNAEWMSWFSSAEVTTDPNGVLPGGQNENHLASLGDVGVITSWHLDKLPYLNKVWENNKFEGVFHDNNTTYGGFFDPADPQSIYLESDSRAIATISRQRLGLLNQNGNIVANDGYGININNATAIALDYFYGETPWQHDSTMNINPENVDGYTILFSLKLKFLSNYVHGQGTSANNNVVFYIDSAARADIEDSTQDVSYHSEDAMIPGTNIDSGLDNYYSTAVTKHAFLPIKYGGVQDLMIYGDVVSSPNFAIEGIPSVINLSIQSFEYTGYVDIFVISSEDTQAIDSFNHPSIELGEQHIAQYGTFQIEGQEQQGSGQIFLNRDELKQVTIFYSPNYVNANQTDTFAIFLRKSEPSFHLYPEDMQEEITNIWNETYNEENLWTNFQIFSIQILDILDEDAQLTLDALDYNPSFETLITKPSDIIYHILGVECGYIGEVDQESILESREQHSQIGLDWDLAFSVNQEIQCKKLIQEISQSSKSIPILSNNILKFINIKNTYDGSEEMQLINARDVINYNFKRTPIDKVLTRVEVKHTFDYGRGNYLNSTDSISVSENHLDGYFITGTYKDYVDRNIEMHNYYRFKENPQTGELLHSTSYLITENNYIRDEGVANQLAKFLLLWNCNQHNIVELTLPLKYYALQTGDLIEFDEMIYGEKAYNENYVLDSPDDMPIRCGQYILPLFMVTETTKGLSNVKIKAIQMHHMEDTPLTYKGNTYEDVSAQYLTNSMSGDASLNYEVNVGDVVLMIKHILGEITLEGQALLNADMTNDGEVRINDVVLVIAKILEE